jgi:hypothetical protein
MVDGLHKVVCLSKYGHVGIFLTFNFDTEKVINPGND